MPRSPLIYNLPPGTTPQQPNTPIESAMFNTAMEDIEQTFNTPTPVQYGGTGATDVITARANLGLDVSSTILAGKVPQPRNLTGLNTLDVDTGLFFLHGEGKTTGSDVGSVRIDRRANYTNPSATFGFVNSALRINSVITGQSPSFETGVAVVMDNHANSTGVFNTTPQHHAALFQANRHGTAPVWGAVIEAVDATFTANPATGIVGIELDIQGSGTDSNSNKQGISIVNRRQGGLSGWTGAANTVGYGIVINKQVGDSANNNYLIGVSLGAPGALTQFDVGIDFSNSTTTLAAIRLNEQDIFWKADGTRKQRYNAGAAALRYEAPGGRTFDMGDDGSFGLTGTVKILGGQVLTSGRPGWSGSVGTANRTAFDTAAVTTEQLAQRVKALIDDLLTHGLIKT